MSSNFSLARRKGYEKVAVDEFLEKARSAFHKEVAEAEVTAKDIRTVGFKLVRKGYDISEVDEALVRLEEAFARRETQYEQAQNEGEHKEQVQGLAQEIVDRIARADHKRFKRAGFMKQGYRIRQVDSYLDELLPVISGEKTISPDEIRQKLFKPQSNGYAETQVDAFLDGVIAALLSIDTPVK